MGPFICPFTLCCNLRELSSIPSKWGTAECDSKGRPSEVFAGRDLQLSTNLRHERTYDFHSKALACSGIVSRGQSWPVILHRKRVTG